MAKVKDKKLLTMLNIGVLIAGFTQGMILTVLSVMMQNNGASSTMIGLHTTSMYIGVLFTAFFIEKLIFNFGYKNNLLVGIGLIVVSLVLLPTFQVMWLWFLLRVLIGIGVMLLQIAAQSWLTDIIPSEQRGFLISIFGVCFGGGFALGPLMMNTLAYSVYLPFLVSAFFYSLAFIGLLGFKNKYPSDSSTDEVEGKSSLRLLKSVKLAWVAFLCPLMYGVMEATLNGVFPAYGLQLGYDTASVSLMISSFAFGSIIFQIPIGRMSDRVGRHKTLLVLVGLGTVCFTGLLMFEENIYAMFGFIILAGVFVGTLFTLGISYMADLLPIHLVPAGSIICSIFYSIGSVGGPLISGGLVDQFPGVSIFYVFAVGLLLLFLSLLYFGQKKPIITN